MVERDDFRELLGAIWLYVDWKYVTKQLTTAQKELWADAVDAFGEQQPGKADRWWREIGHWPMGSPEPSPSRVMFVRAGQNGVTFRRHGCGWTALPPEGDGGTYTWIAINSGPDGADLTEVRP